MKYKQSALKQLYSLKGATLARRKAKRWFLEKTPFYMPLVFLKHIDAALSFALWHITEPEHFFTDQVILYTPIAHPHKRLQHLAGRLLLKQMRPAFPLHQIQIAETKKPFLQGDAFHFSISHCGNYAAAIISETKRVGVDIEEEKPVVEKIKTKFLSANEQLILEALPCNHLTAYTIAWSAKEAMFKWYALGQVDFKMDMQIQNVKLQNNAVTVTALFNKNMNRQLKVNGIVQDGLVFMWLAT